MWARDVEIMIGCWLAMSPFIFGHLEARSGWWVCDFAAALAVIVLAGSSYWRPWRHAHLGQVLIACWVIGFAYSQSWGLAAGAPAAMQNLMGVGLLLMMFGLVPNDAPDPPSARAHGDRVENDEDTQSRSRCSNCDPSRHQSEPATSRLKTMPR